MLTFSLTIQAHWVLVEFQSDDSIQPDSLKTLSPPDPVKEKFAHLGVILSGRGPVWLYGFLVHYYHPALWVATHDPRLQGAVVVASHTLEIKPGDIIKLEIKN